MKAITIPNAALLDVFGRPVAINSHDLHRSSLTSSHSQAGRTEKTRANNQSELTHKQSLGTSIPSPSVGSEERLSVIGESSVHFQY